jgi:MinD superfamily P-loop ATPase
MHEILVISGKGGTGKTSLTAAFAHISTQTVICDLDVDAPDLHLILRPEDSESIPFVSGAEARIRTGLCNRCGTCADLCRFAAVEKDGSHFNVNSILCEGCGVCVRFCPADAIDFFPKKCGHWALSETRFGPLAHAQLYPGEENSGKLVALLRQEARKLAESLGWKILLSDGPPGIGCPVISSISGIDLAVIVTEPTPSGKHDLHRVVELCRHFNVPSAVIINKSNLNSINTDEIQSFCRDSGLPLLAKLPHDPVFVDALVRGMAVTEYSNGNASRQVIRAWGNIMNLLAIKAAA